LFICLAPLPRLWDAAADQPATGLPQRWASNSVHLPAPNRGPAQLCSIVPTPPWSISNGAPRRAEAALYSPDAA